MDEVTDGPSRDGTLLARKYRIEARLGSGGMAEVYRARHEVLGREVAIKFLRPEYAANAVVVARFMRESLAANLVRHPNVVDVLDIDTDDDDVPFIVQELLEGEDLADYLQRVGRTMRPETAVEVLLPAIDAVAMGHTKGVVHRDLKPENVFLSVTERGVVPKVLDFGISKLLFEETTRLTATGTTVGTPGYMSPEQVYGAKTVDARADVWSFGVMLYQLIAGRMPFRAAAQGPLLVLICTEEPLALTEAAPGTAPDLAGVIARCLRKNPAERFATAAELAAALRGVMTGEAFDPTRKRSVVRLDPPPRCP